MAPSHKHALNPQGRAIESSAKRRLQCVDPKNIFLEMQLQLTQTERPFRVNKLSSVVLCLVYLPLTSPNPNAFRLKEPFRTCSVIAKTACKEPTSDHLTNVSAVLTPSHQIEIVSAVQHCVQLKSRTSDLQRFKAQTAAVQRSIHSSFSCLLPIQIGARGSKLGWGPGATWCVVNAGKVAAIGEMPPTSQFAGFVRESGKGMANKRTKQKGTRFHIELISNK